jgi:hypothetical protein
MATTTKVSIEALVNELVDDAIEQVTSFQYDPADRDDLSTDERFGQLVDELYGKHHKADRDSHPDDLMAARERAAAHAGFDVGLELGRRLAGLGRVR